MPRTVNVNAAPPCVALAGCNDAIVGTGLSMVNAIALDVPPPGAGVVTDTLAAPGLAISAAVIVADSDVALPWLSVANALTHCHVGVPVSLTVRTRILTDPARVRAS